MSISEYNNWNREKQNINFADRKNIFIKEKDIWFVKMGKNIGSEEDGKEKFLRPVIVIKKVGNLFFTAAMTSKGKEDSIYYHRVIDINLKYQKHTNSSFIILSQVKVMDKKRFSQKIGRVSSTQLEIINKKLKRLLF